MMIPHQEKTLNYLLFFLISMTVFSSLLLVKNNYLYIFLLLFLFLYWQRFRLKQVSTSFTRFLFLGLVGVLVFQIFSGSPRFRERPVLTLILSLIFYLPYFFLWYKLWLKGKISLLKAFFLSGLLGILFFGLLSGKLTRTILTAPNLAAGLLYVLLQAGGIVSVVGSLTAFPFLFFSTEKMNLPTPTKRVAKKENLGFALVEILLGAGLLLIALSVVGAARHRQNIANQKLTAFEQNRLERLANLEQKVSKEQKETPPIREITPATPKTSEDQEQKSTKSDIKQPVAQSGSKTQKDRTTEKDQTQVQKESPQPVSGKDEVKRPRDQAGKSSPLQSFTDQEIIDPATCQAVPSLAGCEIYYYDPSIYYDPYSDPTSPEYQAQLNEQWYAGQQDPSQLFFTDPVELWSQDPFLYEMYQGIYDFNPVPGLPDIFPGFP